MRAASLLVAEKRDRGRLLQAWPWKSPRQRPTAGPGGTRVLQYKLQEPILDKEKFSGVDIRVRVSSGGHVTQIYAIRQTISKALVAYYQKYVDEACKKEVKDILIQYNRTLIVAGPRRCEPKKFGGPGDRARYHKSYR